MQRTAVIAAVILAFAGSVQAASMDLEASTPASMSAAALDVAGAEWVLLVFRGEGAKVSMPLARDVELQNLTDVYPARLTGPNTDVFYAEPLSMPPTTLAAGTMVELAFQGWSAVYLRASSLSWASTGATATLVEKDDGQSYQRFLAHEDRNVLRTVDPMDAHAVLVFTEGSPAFDLTATNVAFMEWYDADATCQGEGDCPTGGGPSIRRVSSAGGYELTSEAHSYESVRDVDLVEAHGSVAYAVLGGASMDLALTDGTLRLPLASGASSCTGCPAPQGQTFAASGDIVLQDLRMAGQGSLAMRFDGDLTSARFDETPVDAKLLGSRAVMATAAAGGLVLVLKLLYGFLFTRMTPDAALEHPNRKRLYEVIQADPGINFRGLAKATGIAAGTCRHHLTVMARCGLIVEQDHGSTRRFFDNRAAFKQGWEHVVLLREPGLKELWSWLDANPGATQGQALDAMAKQGWRRSTTQHRLSRLEKAGAALVKWQGRFKRYWALAPGRAPPFREPLTTSVRGPATGGNVSFESDEELVHDRPRANGALRL